MIVLFSKTLNLVNPLNHTRSENIADAQYFKDGESYLLPYYMKGDKMFYMLRIVRLMLDIHAVWKILSRSVFTTQSNICYGSFNKNS